MGENTKIPWAHHTFNAWIGCTHVAPECDHCYAEAMAKFRGWARWGSGEPRQRTTPANWRKPIAWNREAGELGIRYRVFCSSLSDVFDPEVPSAWRDDLFELICKTPNLDWLLLTKRPAQMRDYLNALPGAPWLNIWAMVSAGTQKTADAFISILLETNAVVRGVSGEPALEGVDYSRFMRQPWICEFCYQLDYSVDLPSTWDLVFQSAVCSECRGRVKEDGGYAVVNCGAYATTSDPRPWKSRLHWLIRGAESGPHHRPDDDDWYRKDRDDCQRYGVAFFLKQFADSSGRKIETPELDGRTWIEFPTTPYTVQEVSA